MEEAPEDPISVIEMLERMERTFVTGGISRLNEPQPSQANAIAVHLASQGLAGPFGGPTLTEHSSAVPAAAPAAAFLRRGNQADLLGQQLLMGSLLQPQKPPRWNLAAGAANGVPAAAADASQEVQLLREHRQRQEEELGRLREEARRRGQLAAALQHQLAAAEAERARWQRECGEKQRQLARLQAKLPEVLSKLSALEAKVAAQPVLAESPAGRPSCRTAGTQTDLAGPPPQQASQPIPAPPPPPQQQIPQQEQPGGGAGAGEGMQDASGQTRSPEGGGEVAQDVGSVQDAAGAIRELRRMLKERDKEVETLKAQASLQAQRHQESEAEEVQQLKTQLAQAQRPQQLQQPQQPPEQQGGQVGVGSRTPTPRQGATLLSDGEQQAGAGAQGTMQGQGLDSGDGLPLAAFLTRRQLQQESPAVAAAKGLPAAGMQPTAQAAAAAEHSSPPAPHAVKGGEGMGDASVGSGATAMPAGSGFEGAGRVCLADEALLSLLCYQDAQQALQQVEHMERPQLKELHYRVYGEPVHKKKDTKKLQRTLCSALGSPAAPCSHKRPWEQKQQHEQPQAQEQQQNEAAEEAGHLAVAMRGKRRRGPQPTLPWQQGLASEAPGRKVPLVELLKAAPPHAQHAQHPTAAAGAPAWGAGQGSDDPAATVAPAATDQQGAGLGQAPSPEVAAGLHGAAAGPAAQPAAQPAGTPLAEQEDCVGRVVLMKVPGRGWCKGTIHHPVAACGGYMVLLPSGLFAPLAQEDVAPLLWSEGCLVGSTMSKVFPDGVRYYGQVCKYNMKACWYLIRYNDGDREHMEEAELLQHIRDLGDRC